MTSSPQMSKAELIEAAHEIIGSDLADLSLDELYRLMTVTQFVTGRCLNEVERRGKLTYDSGQDGTRLAPIVPYCSDYGLDTLLTRQN
jgi:hypothetical protein